MKQRQDIVSGTVILLIGSVAMIEAVGLPQGAAILPLIGLSALIILSMLLIGRGLIGLRQLANGREVAADDEVPFVSAPKRLLAGIILTALYVAAIEKIGFYPGTALFLPVTAVVLGARNFRAVLAMTVVFLLFIYLVFSVLFERPLPAGDLLSDGAGVEISTGSRHV